jgi:hypothetical protein
LTAGAPQLGAGAAYVEHRLDGLRKAGLPEI